MRPLQRYRHDKATHSATNAFLCATLSLRVYADGPSGSGSFRTRFRRFVDRLTASNERPTITFSNDSKVEWAAIELPKYLLIVFRGTDGDAGEWFGPDGNFPSLLQNAPSSWGSNVRVHRGIYRALSKVYSRLRTLARGARQRGKRVILTGHSRGGSLAILCAYRFAVSSIAVTSVYTFASPRVGNSGFRSRYKAKGLHNRTHRWVRNNDPGPKFPDYGLGVPLPANRYFHVGRLNYIRANGSVKLDHPNPDYENGPLLDPGDHDLKGYLAILHRCLTNRQRHSPTNPRYLVRKDMRASGVPA